MRQLSHLTKVAPLEKDQIFNMLSKSLQSVLFAAVAATAAMVPADKKPPGIQPAANTYYIVICGI